MGDVDNELDILMGIEKPRAPKTALEMERDLLYKEMARLKAEAAQVSTMSPLELERERLIQQMEELKSANTFSLDEDEDEYELLQEKKRLEQELYGIKSGPAPTPAPVVQDDEADYLITMDDDEDLEEWELEEEKRKLEAEIYGMDYVPRPRPQPKPKAKPAPAPSSSPSPASSTTSASGRVKPAPFVPAAQPTPTSTNSRPAQTPTQPARIPASAPGQSSVKELVKTVVVNMQKLREGAVKRDKTLFISSTTASFEAITHLEKGLPQTFELRKKALAVAQIGKALLAGQNITPERFEAPLKDVTDTLKRIIYEYGSTPATGSPKSASPAQRTDSPSPSPNPSASPTSTNPRPTSPQTVPAMQRTNSNAGVSPLAANIPFTGAGSPPAATGTAYDPSKKVDAHHMTTAIGANYSDEGFFKIGVLTKRGGGQRSIGKSSWKKRIFKLSPTALTYWDERPDAKNKEGKAGMKGEISLEDFVWVQAKTDNKKFPFLFHLKTNQRIWEIAADTAAQQKEWMETIDVMGKMLKIAKEIVTKAAPRTYKTSLILVGDNFIRFSSNTLEASHQLLATPLSQVDAAFLNAFRPLVEQLGMLALHLNADIYTEYTDGNGAKQLLQDASFVREVLTKMTEVLGTKKNGRLDFALAGCRAELDKLDQAVRQQGNY